MILFSPMWQHEIERLGWQRCSPAGYLLLNVSDGLSWLALILWIAGLGWPGLLVWLLGRACYGGRCGCGGSGILCMTHRL